MPGVAQSQVNAGAGFGMEVGLRALLQQDPEVIAVGEIRDRATAEVAFQLAAPVADRHLVGGDFE